MRTYARTVCPHCGCQTLCGLGEMRARLEQLGMLRRARDAPPELLVELFTSCAGRMNCPDCGQTGLVAREDLSDEDGWDDWEPSRTCERCGQPIAPERLEVYPHARRCAACQQSEEAGAAGGEAGGEHDVEYCPRCGAPLRLVPRSRGATTRYVLHCDACGRQVHR